MLSAAAIAAPVSIEPFAWTQTDVGLVDPSRDGFVTAIEMSAAELECLERMRLAIEGFERDMFAALMVPIEAMAESPPRCTCVGVHTCTHVS